MMSNYWMSEVGKSAYSEIMRHAIGDMFFNQRTIPHYDGKFDAQLNADIIEMEMMGVL